MADVPLTLSSQTIPTPRGSAVAQVVTHWLPTAAAQVRVQADMWGLWWTKWHWGRFSQSTSVSPANLHSTNFSIIIITRGWHNRPIDSHSAEWTQLDFTSHYTNLKKVLIPMPQPPDSNSNSSWLNRSSPLTDSLTNQLAPLHYTALTKLPQLGR
jgi:hypothetical protein